MTEQYLLEIAERAWNQNRADIGVEDRHPFLLKNWKETYASAQGGNAYDQMIVTDFLNSTRLVLDAVIKVSEEKVARTMESD